jgi:hypothetical protein
MARIKKVNKNQPAKSTGQHEANESAKSNLKAGLGIFKDVIISKPSAWSADLRRTVKK